MSYDPASLSPRTRKIVLAVLGGIVALALILIGALNAVDDPDPQPTPSPTASPSVSPSPSPSVSPSVSPSASPSVTPSQAGGFPNTASTGAPAETGLPAGPCSLAANTTYTGMVFNCNVEARSGSVVRNSVIRGEIKGDPTGTGFTVEDSTIIGNGCAGAAAVGNSNFTLRRVHIKGFNDGVRSEGPNVRVYDSLIEVCFSAGGHADGLQVCPREADCGGLETETGLVFHHNTVTHPKRDSTGAVFVMGGSSPGYVITDNLMMGFSYTVRLHVPGTFTGNRVVNDSGLYGEFDIKDVCPDRGMVWSDNRLVTMVGPPPPSGETAGDLNYGPDYAIASTGAEVRC